MIQKDLQLRIRVYLAQDLTGACKIGQREFKQAVNAEMQYAIECAERL